MQAISRHLEATVRDRLGTSPAVVLHGPRQVGKTTLARRIAADWPGGATYLDLERPADQLRLADADAYLRDQRGKLVVIDEIQHAPDLFKTLRGIIDERRAAGDRHGHFLLLCSAALELMHQASESLAGRVAYLDLAPFTLDEITPVGIDENSLWLRGGFPESLLAADDKSSLDWRRDFIRAYLQRGVPMFAPRLPAATVGRLWVMLAHLQGSPFNQARLASSLGVSAPAVGRYVDLLVDLKLVRRLPPWSGNLGKRLTKAPKLYIRDSGLTHALLELETRDQLLGHPVTGPSYEGIVIENLIEAAGERRTACYFRTADGAEVDLVLERGGKPEMAIEIKRSSALSLDRGFAIACDDLGIAERYVVYPGDECFPLRHGAQATSLAALMTRLRQSVM